MPNQQASKCDNFNVVCKNRNINLGLSIFLGRKPATLIAEVPAPKCVAAAKMWCGSGGGHFCSGALGLGWSEAITGAELFGSFWLQKEQEPFGRAQAPACQQAGFGTGKRWQYRSREQWRTTLKIVHAGFFRIPKNPPLEAGGFESLKRSDRPGNL